jgi:hypothetical protein
MIDLQSFYLAAIETAADAEGFGTVLHALGKGQGRLYFIPAKGTRADVVLSFEFQENGVRFQLVMRNGHQEAAVFDYVEGIDAFIAGMVRALRAGLLAAPKAAAGRRAA